MIKKTIVAVPADRKIVERHPYHAVCERYLSAVADGAGALPLVIPVMEDAFEIDDILDRCDGVLLTGSPSNIEPHHYNGDPSEEGTLHDAERDAVTLPLARRALDLGIPILAICRGYQEMNVVLGGTLHQKVVEVEGYHDHSYDLSDPLDVQFGPSHAIHLTEGGMLRALAESDTVIVNSLHAQGVARLADGVTVEAVADDGLIEAFRVDDAPGFNLAVQWHPEWRVGESEFSMAIFKAFGDACRQRASRRQGAT